ncbi:hypothetical protein [Flavivirga eckloniae]|uniref:Uncharacterized protein n=1 Tax=Flavivirga eckloniae TaxID=1803846 RepID=A0A2K9PM31_9FLAO|nr:hypothetical protein [Flavivirga eckloniae]AUP78085.1 hypothetical protein C1H87_04890 [Flavivirga eckloniae]
MKHYIFFLFLFCTFLSSSQTENYHIKVVYEPNQTYTYRIKETSSINTFKDVDKDMKRMLDSIGSVKSLKSGKEESFRMKISTFNLDSEGNIPIKILFDQLSYKGFYEREKINKEHGFKSLKLVGKINSKNKVQIDEVFVDNLKSKNESMIKLYYKNVESTVFFPDNALSIGDSFILEKPLRLLLAEKPAMLENAPIKDIISNNTKNKFTLTKVKADKAYFDVEGIVELNKEEVPNNIINLNVKSKGKIEVNIKDKHINKVSLESYLSYDEILFENNVVNFNYKFTLKINAITQ